MYVQVLCHGTRDCICSSSESIPKTGSWSLTFLPAYKNALEKGWLSHYCSCKGEHTLIAPDRGNFRNMHGLYHGNLGSVHRGRRESASNCTVWDDNRVLSPESVLPLDPGEQKKGNPGTDRSWVSSREWKHLVDYDRRKEVLWYALSE